MATVEGLTKPRMLAIEAASVVDGEIDSNGHLILTTHGGTTIDAGDVMQPLDLIRDALYPVGAIFMSASSANPSVTMGGTWVAWGTGRVPVGVDTGDTDFNTVEKTGGAKTHLLTAAEMPSHTHVQNAHTHTQQAHRHVLPGGIVMPAGVTGSTAAGVAAGGGFGFQYLTNPAAASINTTGALNDSTTAVNQSTGGGGSHNIQQKFITCYMWKRTA